MHDKVQAQTPFLSQVIRLALIATAIFGEPSLGFAATGVDGPVPSATARGSAAAFWRDAADGDVQAAHELIAANHPAMLREADDPGFRTAEAAALETSRSRATGVSTCDGYTARLAAYAVALNDAHRPARGTPGCARAWCAPPAA